MPSIQQSPRLPALVAGSGHGLRVLAPAMRAAGFDVLGLVGCDPARTKRRAGDGGIGNAFTDLDAAIAATGAIAVAVATPPHTHAALVHAALARGCHVLCEKPFARNAEEARQMLLAAQRAGTVHLTGNQFRMLPDRPTVARAIAEGLIGEPRVASIIHYTDVIRDPNAKWPSWWFDPDAGGGWLGASGSHMIDMLRTWLGEFASLSAVLSNTSERTSAAEDSYQVRFTMRSGVHGLLMQTGGAWGGMVAATRVAGTHGTLSLDRGKVWLSDRNGTRELPIAHELELPGVSPSDDPRRRFLHIELPPAIRLCEAWRAAILGKPVGSVAFATFADGVACMEVIDAIRASAAAGGALVAVA